MKKPIQTDKMMVEIDLINFTQHELMELKCALVRTQQFMQATEVSGFRKILEKVSAIIDNESD